MVWCHVSGNHRDAVHVTAPLYLNARSLHTFGRGSLAFLVAPMEYKTEIAASRLLKSRSKVELNWQRSSRFGPSDQWRSCCKYLLVALTLSPTLSPSYKKRNIHIYFLLDLNEHKMFVKCKKMRIKN